MAQIETESDGSQGARVGAVTTLTSWAGAAMSAALVGGLVVWGWQLTVRDVAGVPVIRAMDGPMRMAPESAGGARAAYQGLDVNRVAENVESGLPDRLVLAPGPVELAAEDMPALPQRAVAEAETEERRPDVAETPSLAGTDLAVAEALGMSSDAMLVQASLRVEPAEIEGWTRPAPRPAAARPSFDTSAVGVQELDAAELESGERLVQLGAFDSAEAARAGWERLADEFDGYLDGKKRVVQQASTGGEAFWRLRAAGFEDLADARRFCSALVARQADCIPARVR